MKKRIKEAVRRIDELSKSRNIRVVSHFDTDGVTSAAIFSRTLERWGKKFTLNIVSSLDKQFIDGLGDEELIIFLDLASNSLEHLERKKSDVFIFDHHEIVRDIPDNVFMVNPLLTGDEPVSSAGICYLFSKEVSVQNKDLANLAVVGMVGDMHDKDIKRNFAEIIRDCEAIVKKGLLIYPSTRPLNIALEYSSSPYMPGVSGSREGVLELLRDAGLYREGGNYKALYELDEGEMQRLVTAILLRKPGEKDLGMIGNIFLVKFFNKLEDAREMSALINSCSRMDYPEVALGLCLGNKKMKEEADRIYINYRQSLVSALRYVEESEKIQGKDYVIINGGDKIKDTIIGTVASIISHSHLYEEGLIIIALARNGDKIKVSARISGRRGRNVREVLSRAVLLVGGEVGGHPNAAGCLISKDKEEEFIGELRKVLELEIIKV